MNGERVLVILSSRSINNRFDEGTVHTVLQVTGKKVGRVMSYTELEMDPFETRSNWRRLDA